MYYVENLSPIQTSKFQYLLIILILSSVAEKSYEKQTLTVNMVFLSRVLGLRFIKRHTNPFLGKPTSSHDPYWSKVSHILSSSIASRKHKTCHTSRNFK